MAESDDTDSTRSERDALVDELRTIIEWVSERDHHRAVALDSAVHDLEALARAEAATAQTTLDEDRQRDRSYDDLADEADQRTEDMER